VDRAAHAMPKWLELHSNLSVVTHDSTDFPMPPPQRIRTAVFPVAGMGTRFLPATKAVPKEMLPVVDKPVIQYAVEEAREAGIEKFIFVTGRGKHVIEDHFDHAYELEALLEVREKTKELNSLLESLPGTGSVAFTRQQKPLGLGHAVWCARHLVGDEAFAVLLPDDLMVGSPGALKQMADAYERTGGGIVIAAEEKPREETERYGVVKPGRVQGSITEVKGVVEKPKPADAPSTLCIIGRYILTPAIFAELERRERGTGNEIQLTDAMARLLGRVPFHAVTTNCARYDCGDKVGFLQANLAVGLGRPDIAPALKEVLRTLKY
jgi:UTP--glucose-1-phosphate uridylyltransferase